MTDDPSCYTLKFLPPTSCSQPVNEHRLSQLEENSEPFGERGFQNEKPGETGKLGVAKKNGDMGHDGISLHCLLGWVRWSTVIVAPFLGPTWVCHRRVHAENTRSPQSSVHPSTGLFWVLSKPMEGQPCQDHAVL